MSGGKAKDVRGRLRRNTVLGLGLCICIAIYAYIALYLQRPIGEGPAGPSVDSSAFQQPWSQAPVHLLGVGDSITAGLGARDPSHSYFQRLIHNPTDEFPELEGINLKAVLPNLTAQNIAVSGSTSLHHEEYLNEGIEGFAENVVGLVVMTSGGNDIIHNYGRSEPREGAMYGATLEQARPWIEAYEARLNRILDRLSTLFPAGCEVFLADIYDPTDGVGDAPSVFLPPWKDGLAIHGEYNRVIRRVAAERDNVFVVPLHQTFLGHGSHCRQFWRSHYDASDPHYWYFDNIEDPNDRGYDAIRRIFLTAIAQHTRLRSPVVGN